MCHAAGASSSKWPRNTPELIDLVVTKSRSICNLRGRHPFLSLNMCLCKFPKSNGKIYIQKGGLPPSITKSRSICNNQRGCRTPEVMPADFLRLASSLGIAKQWRHWDVCKVGSPFVPKTGSAQESLSQNWQCYVSCSEACLFLRSRCDNVCASSCMSRAGLH